LEVLFGNIGEYTFEKIEERSKKKEKPSLVIDEVFYFIYFNFLFLYCNKKTLMNRREKRKRISENNIETIIDVEAWLENCASKKVRHHTTFTENFQIEFWYDKHYWDRLHLGDDDGDRVGIEFEYVEPLVVKSFKHLMYYSLKHRDLLFVNHPPPKTRNIRVVLRQTFVEKTKEHIMAPRIN
jgi:hypothetical protein